MGELPRTAVAVLHDAKRGVGGLYGNDVSGWRGRLYSGRGAAGKKGAGRLGDL
ncbi:hypothetical protein D3C78_794550 [compost metagenome]